VPRPSSAVLCVNATGSLRQRIQFPDPGQSLGALGTFLNVFSVPKLLHKTHVTQRICRAVRILPIPGWVSLKTPPCPRCSPHVTAACPDSWVGYQGNCYYFSETEGNWNNSQSHCSSLSASLASIDSLPELDFMQRYRGILYHWIGLHREQGQGQPWKWTNGTIFNNLLQVRGEGQCAYLDAYGVSSSRCYSDRHFICKRPDECSRRKPTAAGGDTMCKIT
uniref:C-type lectin domain-containing protein n=1 Tax=Chrysemys picta bellii TaxID=8478 RepID=A0A8C3HGS5_CHRPI